MKTKKQLTNRILSLVLTAVMVLGMIPISSFTAFAADESYNLWVGGVQFDSDNLTITDDDGDGTATYEHDSNILTLNNYTYTGAGYGISEWRGAAIYYDDNGTGKTLNLVLKGTNSVTHSGFATGSSAVYSYGVYANGSITVKGDGSLSGTGDTPTGSMNSESYGVYAKGSINVTGGRLHGTGGTVPDSMMSKSYGVYSYDVITVSGDGRLHGTGGASTSNTLSDNYGVYAQGGITVEGNGSLNGTCGAATGNRVSESFGVFTNGNITVKSGSLTGTGGMSSRDSYGMQASGYITVEGDGSLTGTGGMSSRYSYGVQSFDNITVKDDGSLSGIGGEGSTSYGVYVSGDLLVTGGSLNGTGVEGGSSYGVRAYGSISVEGGEFIAKGNDFALLGSLTITIAGTLAVYDESGAVIEDPVWTGNGALTYAKIAAKSAEPEVPANAVASVTRDDVSETVYCTTLGEAINKVSDAQVDDNAVVKLLKDVEESVVQASGVFTLELNGKTWQFSGSQNLYISYGAELTIQDSSSDQTGRILADESSEYGYVIRSNGTLNITGGTFTANKDGISLIANDGTLNITGGTILVNSKSPAIMNLSGTLNISGGTVSAPSGIAIVNRSNMTLNGGNINGFAGIDNYGTATLEDGTVTASTVYALYNDGTAYLSGADLITQGGNPAISCKDASETTISGGTIRSAAKQLIWRNGGKLTITDNVNCNDWTFYTSAGAAVGTDIILPADHYVFDGDKLVTELNEFESYTIRYHKHTYSYIENGNAHYGKCDCGTVTADENHTLTYSANEDTNTITAVCDICRKVFGSASLKVPKFAYYTNSSVFSAAYGSSFENGEEVKLTYDGGSETVPSSLGVHTATLTVYEGGEVKASVSAEYEITYLPTPQNAYNISGGYQAEGTHWFKEGETVTVTAPNGYKVSKELGGNYGSSVTFSQGDDMVIYLKDENGAMTDAINVTGVRFDGSAPTGKITVTERNFWEKLLNKITFGLFFKGDMVATVTYSDTDSGVASVEYYIASEDLIADPALNNAAAVAKLENVIGGNWKTYSDEITLNNNAKNVIYVKITDNVGNVTYLSSDSIVLDSIAPIIEGIENGGVYYGDKVFKATDENFLKIEVDGVDITETTESNDEFKILADNLKHTVTVTDEAGNVTEYTITVYKRYSVTFTDGEGGSYEKEFKYGEVITIPTNEFFEDTFRKTGYTLTEWQGYTEGMTMPLENLTFTAIYTPNQYAVEFDTNGGEAIAPITVTFDEKYGRLPSSSVAGFSGGDKNWYLVDANGNVTETNIKNLTLVSTARDHKLFIKRNVLSPNVSITLTVPGGISDGYQYYIPGASQRVLTATVNNANTELLSYTYQWYKDGAPIEGATASVLTLDGNVADSGIYKVEVTATLKNGTGIVVTTSSATGSKEQNVKIMRATNTLSYDANGGEGGPQSSYTGGTSLNVSKDEPTREHYDFIGWNTKADGSGDSYKANDTYNFISDGGNGGCTVTLYAQWKAKEYTVTYMANGQTVFSEKVEYGKDATLPAVPHKDGYVGKWDSDGKNIAGDTTIRVIYTAIPVIKPDEVKPEDKTDLEDDKKQLEDMLNNNSYTEDDKKAIQDVIDDIDEALEVIGNVEAVEGLIDKLPGTIKKDDEAAIKAADDAYNALTDYEKSLVDKDAKKALDDAKAALAELNKPADPNSPTTGDNSNMFLWIALLFISGGAVITLTVVDRKRKAKEN